MLEDVDRAASMQMRAYIHEEGEVSDTQAYVGHRPSRGAAAHSITLEGCLADRPLRCRARGRRVRRGSGSVAEATNFACTNP